ncbi:c-type cytochrome biogenesis protein CcmI [Microbulbifer rhizosphaerae]|uniref:Cytochrome c-type biogenesis protein CcmH n=1 Tax=Microbulbifer rhizosphaerae TaxID=1562603 RepID=A0A7W4WAT9_9GAMM|nr:c-type cytochrome biogenesis protein CcmI [Microbulbifer rhizosphaerae]MBB3060814.1 cytochrome c-type biogenesis protein CcmH [Microbulbifer rhizosphaerae]
MTELWLGLALLILPLAFVILWPALRGVGARQASDKRAALAALYREQRAELQSALDSGSIDRQQYAQLEAEMARNLLAAEESAGAKASSGGGRSLLIGLAALVPLLALGLYAFSDRYDDLALYRDVVASQQGRSDEQAEARITRQLRERTQTHPEDLTGRYVLAQRLLVSGDPLGAVAEYRAIVASEPQAVGIKAELAQALFFAGGSRVTEEVRELVHEVLQVQPGNGTALGLAGIAAFDREEYRAARDYWRRALDRLSPDSMAAQALAAGVARAEAALAEQGEPVAAKADAPAADGSAIRVEVKLGEGVSPEPATPVFIYARGADSPMPLAIVKLTAGQLPAEVVLDESRAMMPGRSLKGADSVQLVARLAVNGDARPAPGDWQGAVESLPRSEWNKPQAITIDDEL